MNAILNTAAFIREGGYPSYAVVILGIVTAAIALERWIRIHYRYSVNSRAFMAKLRKYVLSDNIDRAISLCNSRPDAVLPRVLKAGLTRAKDSTQDIQNAIDEATLEVLPKLEARVLYLPIFANLATLLGLFGTILGLIEAFQAGTQAVDAVTRQQFLQQAIAVAMHTTALGLCVAIPVLLVYSVIQARVNYIISDIDQYSVKLINLLSAAQKNPSSATEKGRPDEDDASDDQDA